jgi:hypothetical protein
LACLCIFIGLVVLVPGLNKVLLQSILQPAVDVLTNGLQYSADVIGMK